VSDIGPSALKTGDEVAKGPILILSTLGDTLHRRFFKLISILPARAHSKVLRRYFDWWYSIPDPWGYAVERYEHEKYAVTLLSVPPSGYRRILDAGCSEGLFTHILAKKYPEAHIVGVDISERAIQRARRRAKSRSTAVEFVAMDILSDHFHEQFDLVFCSDVLYYLGRNGRRRLAAQRLRALIAPGGLLVLIHPWPETQHLYRHFDADPILTRVVEHVSLRQPRFAVTIYQSC
jgi:SAM-dependent methyltransferase